MNTLSREEGWAGAECNGLKACAIICLQETINKKKKNEIIQVFWGSCTRNTLLHRRPSVLFQLGASFDQQGAPNSRRDIDADVHSVTSLAGNTIITSHIHLFFKAGTNTRQTSLKLDVSGPDAVVIQAEGEAGVRLRLWAVPPAPAGHVACGCNNPQSAAGSRWRHGGARGRGGEGVGGGWGGGGGGGGGEGGQGGHGAEGAVFILRVQDGGLTRRDGHPGLPAGGHGAGLDQLRSALVALLTSRPQRGIVTFIVRGRTSEWETLQPERDKHLISVFILSPKNTETEMINRERTVTFGGPLKSWIFSSMSLIQPCISSGESVCREEAPGDIKLHAAAVVHPSHLETLLIFLTVSKFSSWGVSHGCLEKAPEFADVQTYIGLLIYL